MAKSFIDVVQDSPRTKLGIPVKTKNQKRPLGSTDELHQPGEGKDPLLTDAATPFARNS